MTFFNFLLLICLLIACKDPAKNESNQKTADMTIILAGTQAGAQSGTQAGSEAGSEAGSQVVDMQTAISDQMIPVDQMSFTDQNLMNVDMNTVTDMSIKPPRYGAWSEWSVCVDGLQQRTRACISGLEQEVDCQLCGPEACAEQQSCTTVDCALIGRNVAWGGDCRFTPDSAECMSNYQNCSAVLQEQATLCDRQGCIWVGAIECSIGGSVSNLNVYGGKGDCLANGQNQYHYSDWSNWGQCLSQQQSRTRACLDLQNQVVDCALCGGLCDETQACESYTCDQLGVNVVDCSPNVPGNYANCSMVLVQAKTRCENNGCRWQGPTECRIGGSVSNGNCYGEMGSCVP
jgi:hypothetical protein